MLSPRTQKRLKGLFCCGLGIALTVYTWQQALHEGRYYLKASVAGPVLAIVGLGLFFVPALRSERGVTARWWLLAVALSAGLFNWYRLAHAGPSLIP